MSKVIAIANQKGGVTKTTTATALAAGLKQKGYRVLLIDTDPQCNASDTFQAQIDGAATLYDLLCEGTPASETIQSTISGDIIASDPHLKNAEKLLSDTGREYMLREGLAQVADNYDYTIIDTPPTLGVLLLNALTVADSVLVPITADRYSLQGLSDFKFTISTVQKFTNPALRIEGLLLSKYNNRTLLTKEITELLPQIASMLNTQVFDTKIRESIAAREAQAKRTNIFSYAPKSTTAQDYAAFIEEFLRKEEVQYGKE